MAVPMCPHGYIDDAILTNCIDCMRKRDLAVAQAQLAVVRDILARAEPQWSGDGAMPRARTRALIQALAAAMDEAAEKVKRGA